MKKVLKILFGIAFSICIVIGGYKLMKQIEYNQMVEIVESDEARAIYEDRLRRIDLKLFEKEGVIKNYAIDYESIMLNPMGGIMVSVYVNNNRNYVFSFTLNREPNTGKLISEGGVNDPVIIRKVEENATD